MDEDLSVFFLILYDVILYCCDKDFSKKKIKFTSQGLVGK